MESLAGHLEVFKLDPVGHREPRGSYRVNNLWNITHKEISRKCKLELSSIEGLLLWGTWPTAVGGQELLLSFNDFVKWDPERSGDRLSSRVRGKVSRASLWGLCRWSLHPGAGVINCGAPAKSRLLPVCIALQVRMGFPIFKEQQKSK